MSRFIAFLPVFFPPKDDHHFYDHHHDIDGKNRMTSGCNDGRYNKTLPLHYPASNPTSSVLSSPDDNVHDHNHNVDRHNDVSWSRHLLHRTADGSSLRSRRR
jgi:hypothetical protein